MVTYDGKTDDERALWFTYLYWGRERLQSNPSGAMVDDPARRISDEESRALQAVVFSAFALEFRLKRVLTYCSASLKPNEGLKDVLKDFWERLIERPRVDGKGKIVGPVEWDNVVGLLNELADLRNNIAHSDLSATLAFIRTPGEDPTT